MKKNVRTKKKCKFCLIHQGFKSEPSSIFNGWHQNQSNRFENDEIRPNKLIRIVILSTLLNNVENCWEMFILCEPHPIIVLFAQNLHTFVSRCRYLAALLTHFILLIVGKQFVWIDVLLHCRSICTISNKIEKHLKFKSVC